MKEPRRLFDCLQYQQEHHPLTDALAAKENGQWKTYSTQEVRNLVNQLSAGLLNLGVLASDMSVEKRDKVAVISKNRPEWVMLDLAVQQIGAVLTPFYPTITAGEMQFVLQDAAVKYVFVNDKELYQKVDSLRASLPALQGIYTFEQEDNLPHWTSMLDEVTPSLAEHIKRVSDTIRSEDLATIIYTSGTTGVPKGVMLSHKNILSNVFSSFQLFDEIGITGQRALSFLPLNHAFERTATYCYLYMGCSIYYAEGMETIGENLREVNPTVFTTVPRLLEKVYEGIMAKGAQLTGIKQKLFHWSVDLAKRYEINAPLSLGYRAQLALADRLIFSKWREALGGNVKAIITGAAACQVKLLRIFTAAKIVVMEGYGLTETSPVISGNRFKEENRMFGTVGPLLKDVQVKIAEDGEILVKGPNVMMGYYKRPDLTADVFVGEWFRTGDIGELVDGKFLKITDRKKEIFKTSGGKYVAPQPIENKLVESPWIEQIMVVGADQKFVSALIVPAFNKIREWFKETGRTYPGNEVVVSDKSVVGLIREAINHYNPQLNQVEQVKKFELLPREWTVDGGELTPTLKLKRKVILEKYQEIINKIYPPASLV
ncbi:long-chain fatty acid--CoA ligase [Nibrella saemangeumensis]|uniref:Long-chain fatty acid--CoA ligase n=1 Tax=Nibrella saemangeumensis TaxID=1084526 RepID=A0ABP8MUH6_9BACT